jgi:dipeptidyl-peptidase 4
LESGLSLKACIGCSDHQRFIMTVLSLLLLPLVAAVEPARQPRQPQGGGDKIMAYNETAPTASYAASSMSVSWVSGEEDGQYITEDDDGALVLQSIVTGDSRVLVEADAVPEDYWEYCRWFETHYCADLTM